MFKDILIKCTLLYTYTVSRVTYTDEYRPVSRGALASSDTRDMSLYVVYMLSY